MPRRQVQRSVDAFLVEIINELVAGNSVKVRGFGTITATAYDVGERHHPKTRELITGLKGVRVSVALSGKIKERILKKFASDQSAV